jgi:hypothetical protein
MKCVTSNGEEVWTLVPVEAFENEVIRLSPGIDAAGADCLDIDYTEEYRHPSVTDDRRVEFWVRSADRARELGRFAAAAAPPLPDEEPASTSAPAPLPTPPSEEPKRTLRRWSAKYEWDTIYAEIASRCIDFKTRQVKVPKNESKLVEAVLQWCEDNNKPQPGMTDMHGAVRAICAALRKI